MHYRELAKSLATEFEQNINDTTSDLVVIIHERRWSPAMLTDKQVGIILREFAERAKVIGEILYPAPRN